MEKESIRKVQLVQLELMKKVHAICVENGIKYILMGGSLLGAIRHKGFIPWDDDLDIALIRPEYEKLMKVLACNPIEGCFLQTYFTDKHYVQPFAKLRKDNTEFVETYFAKVKMHCGIFIDIFPFDKISSPQSKGARLRMLAARLITFSIWRKEGSHIPRKGLKKLEIVFSKCVGLLPKKRLVSMQEALVNRENRNWEYVASMYSSNYKLTKTYMKREDITDVILAPFEDTQFYIPRKYDEMLTRIFKNYMEYPPMDKRNSGHEVLSVKF